MSAIHSSGRRRVPAMAPDDRRAALILATVPLLREHGVSVTTRQIAQAAGVAEGTIFRAFADKESLVRAALAQALDPTETLAAVSAIDVRTDLRSRLSEAADLVNRRFAENALLMPAARAMAMADPSPETRRRMAAFREKLLAALTAVIEPDRARLRRSPATVARLLLLLAGANTFGPYGDPERFNGAEMVALLLDGLLVRATESTTTGVP